MWPLVIGAVATIGSSLIGANAQSKARTAAQKTRQDILRRIDALQVPDIEKERLLFEEFKVAGVLEPEIEEVFTASDSELEQIVTDPRLKEAQFGGIEALTKIAEGEGFSNQDRARFEQAKQEAGIAARGRREAGEQSLRRRGLGGSGLEVQSALDSEQAASERLGQEGLQTAGLGSERALQAILQRSELGGQVRGQEYGEQARAAQAQDVINRFNVGQRSNSEARRVDAINRANQYNLAQKQGVSDANVKLSNVQQEKNKSLYDRDFQRKLQKESIASGAQQGIAKGQEAAGVAAGNVAAGVGTGLAKLSQTYYDAQNRKKT